MKISISDIRFLIREMTEGPPDPDPLTELGFTKSILKNGTTEYASPQQDGDKPLLTVRVKQVPKGTIPGARYTKKGAVHRQRGPFQIFIKHSTWKVFFERPGQDTMKGVADYVSKIIPKWAEQQDSKEVARNEEISAGPPYGMQVGEWFINLPQNLNEITQIERIEKLIEQLNARIVVIPRLNDRLVPAFNKKQRVGMKSAGLDPDEYDTDVPDNSGNSRGRAARVEDRKFNDMGEMPANGWLRSLYHEHVQSTRGSRGQHAKERQWTLLGGGAREIICSFPNKETADHFKLELDTIIPMSFDYGPYTFKEHFGHWVHVSK